MENTKQLFISEHGVLAMFAGGLNLHLQSAAECGTFVSLNDNACKVPAIVSPSLLKCLTCQSLGGVKIIPLQCQT